MAFCQWLSKRTGTRCTLPTEAEWEWACRAGTATPWAFGPEKEGLRPVANFADASLRGWGWGRVEAGYSDGVRFSAPVGSFVPNAWGLHDMHGNVWEWTRSAYRPYPYREEGGRGPAEGSGLRVAGSGLRVRGSVVAHHASRVTRRVVRGGSWNDLLRFGRSASRWRYPPHQPVYNVGFRVLCRRATLARRQALGRPATTP
jgi:formylglycine-generating enzyme required for sulfatase activity